MPLAIVDFRRFDAAKYEVICYDWYNSTELLQLLQLLQLSK